MGLRAALRERVVPFAVKTHRWRHLAWRKGDASANDVAFSLRESESRSCACVIKVFVGVCYVHQEAAFLVLGGVLHVLKLFRQPLLAVPG